MANRLRQTVQSIEATPAEQRMDAGESSSILQDIWKNMSSIDKLALLTAPLPVVGDAVGFAADTAAFVEEPTWTNAVLGLAGLIPFVPSGTVTRTAGKGLEGILEGLKTSSQKAAANIRNDIPGFYATGATQPQKYFSVAKTIPEGITNIAKARYSPEARAIQQEYNISVADQKAARKALKVSEQETAKIKELNKQLQKAKESGENTKKIEEAIKDSRRKANIESKKAMGQLNQSRSFSNQYYGPEGGSKGFLHNIDKIDHIKTFPTFNVDDYYKEVGKLSGMPKKDISEIFKQIQKLPAIDMDSSKKYQMNIRRSHTGSAGTLDPGTNKAVFNGKTLNTVKKELFSSGKAYESNDVFLEQLQKNGYNVLNPEEVLKGRAAIITGSAKTDAFELGGVNYMTAINKKGKLISIVNDEHDLFNMKLPGGDRYMNVSEPIVYDLAKQKKLTATQSSAKEKLKGEKKIAVEKAIEEYKKVPGVDISGKVPEGFKSREEWARVQAVANLKPTEGKDWSRLQKEAIRAVPLRVTKPVSRSINEEEENKKHGGSIVERNPYNYQPKAI